MTADLTLWLVDGEHWQFMLRGSTGSGIDALNRRLNRTAESIEAQAEASSAAAELTEVRVLVPAERVLASKVALPARTRRQLQRALPFAVEEKLAIDLDRVHIASSVLRPNEASSVRVVDPDYLDSALAKLRALGLQVESMHSDADCLPLTTDLALLIDGDRALLRDRSGRALACARSVAAMVVGIASRSLRASDTDLVSGTAYVQVDAPLTPAEHAALLAALGSASTAGLLDVQPVLAAMSLLAGVHVPTVVAAESEASARAVVDAPIDLLQGRFARPRVMRGDWKIWKPVAVAALVLVGLQPLLDGGRAWRFDKDTARIQAQTAALYASLFPGQAVPADIRRAFAKRLGGDTGADVGFRPLLTAVADVTSNTPDFELQSISYQRERDEMALQVLAGSLSDLERFKTGFAGRQLVAEVSSAEQEQERVRARLRVHSVVRSAP